MKKTIPQHRLQRARRIRQAMLDWRLQEYSIDAIIDACEWRALEMNVPLTKIMDEVERAARMKHHLALVWLEPPFPICSPLRPRVVRESRFVRLLQWCRRMLGVNQRKTGCGNEDCA